MKDNKELNKSETNLSKKEDWRNNRRRKIIEH